MAKKKDNPVEMADEDLLTAIADTKEELFNLRFQNVTGQLDNYSKLTTTRRQVARLKTELRSREIRAAEAMAGSEEMS